MSEARTEEQRIAAIAAAKDAYHTLVDSGNRHELATASEAVVALQLELAAFLAQGAQPCPGFVITHHDEDGKARGNVGGTCGRPPAAMLKTPAILDGDGIPTRLALYEVGCPDCIGRARGTTPAMAVERWNAGLYVTDQNGQIK